MTIDGVLRTRTRISLYGFHFSLAHGKNISGVIFDISKHWNLTILQKRWFLNLLVWISDGTNLYRRDLDHPSTDFVFDFHMKGTYIVDI